VRRITPQPAPSAVPDEDAVRRRLCGLLVQPSVRQELAAVFRRNRLHAEGPEREVDSFSLVEQLIADLSQEALGLVAEVGGLRFTVEVRADGGLVLHAHGWDEDQWRQVAAVTLG